MNVLPAQEIKRKGISAVDEALKNGAVHIIKNNQPRYVVLSEESYNELVKAEEEGYLQRIKASQEDIKVGRVKRYKNAKSLIKAMGL